MISKYKIKKLGINPTQNQESVVWARHTEGKSSRGKLKTRNRVSNNQTVLPNF